MSFYFIFFINLGNSLLLLYKLIKNVYLFICQIYDIYTLMNRFYRSFVQPRFNLCNLYIANLHIFVILCVKLHH